MAILLGMGCAVWLVGHYFRRPLWTHRPLPTTTPGRPESKAEEFVGWSRDDQIVMAQLGSLEQPVIRVLQRTDGVELTRIPVPMSIEPRLRSLGYSLSDEGAICWCPNYVYDSSGQHFEIEGYLKVDLRSGQLQRGAKPHNHAIRESSSGRWRFERIKSEWFLNTDPTISWPSAEQMDLWGPIPSIRPYDPLLTRLEVRDVKFSDDETLLATIWVQYEEPQLNHFSHRIWEGRLHAWPSGELLDRWPLEDPDQGYEFVPHPWRNGTFLIDETYDAGYSYINRWSLCQIDESRVRRSPLSWSKDYRLLDYQSGFCLETHFERVRLFPRLHGWLSRLIGQPFQKCVDLLFAKSNGPVVRDPITGQVIWSGPDGFHAWQLSRDGRSIVGTRSDGTLAVWEIEPSGCRWFWYAGIWILGGWLWNWLTRSGPPVGLNQCRLVKVEPEAEGDIGGAGAQVAE